MGKAGAGQGNFVECTSLCLKITEKVAFKIASEASYVYNLIKNGQFGEFLKKFKCDIFGDFKTLCTFVSSFLAVFRLTIHNLSAAIALAVPDETRRLTPSITLKIYLIFIYWMPKKVLMDISHNCLR